MKAARLHELGGPEHLLVEDVPRPEPSAEEVLVRVRAAALNHRDVFITQGLYQNIALPRTLGADGAGELDGQAVIVDPTLGWGSDERVWSPRATILGMPHDGTFAQYVAVPKSNVHAKPAHLTYEEAAAIPLAGVTAYRALFARGELRAGDTVLITGIGGGVQTFALLFAKAAGARVLVTSSSDEKLQRARELGADEVFNYRTDEEWHKGARSAGPIDLAIDSAAGDTFAKILGIVRPGGRVVTYGRTAGDSTIKVYPIFWNQIDVRGSSMGSPANFRAMVDFIGEHRIRPVIDRVYELDEIVDAAKRMDEARQFGKIVLRIP
ncbi:MAG TPA: zinc-binding dehydrogenase [Candidatus Baltobacteraceae bacterium]|jgi:NADPH:quinone reductase-like Zn-dependent oxidoreductase|nr:zinc-binding dehydrogenase [Candidatus Baltobacteraceae bacterium]